MTISLHGILFFLTKENQINQPPLILFSLLSYLIYLNPAIAGRRDLRILQEVIYERF